MRSRYRKRQSGGPRNFLIFLALVAAGAIGLCIYLLRVAETLAPEPHSAEVEVDLDLPR